MSNPLSTPPPAASRRSGVLYATLVVLSVIVTVVMADGLDLSVYQYGGLTMRIEPDALYASTTGRPGDPGLPFTYPPFAAALMVPLSYLSHLAGHAVMTALSVGLAAAVAADLAPRLPRALPVNADRLAPWSPAALLVVVLATGPYRATLELGQINIVLLAACYLAVARWGLGFWTGVAIGVCGAVKLTPLALGLLPAARRRWDCVAGIAVGFAASTGAALAAFPSLSASYWLEVLHDPARVGGLAYFENVSIRGMLARFGLEGSALWLALSLVVVGAFWWFLSRRGRDGGPPVGVAALGLAALPMLAISPVTWSHHWVWLPAVALAVRALRGQIDDRSYRCLAASGAVVAVYLAIGPRWTLVLLGLDPRTTPTPALAAHLSDLPALWILLAAALLVVGRIRLRPQRAEPALRQVG